MGCENKPVLALALALEVLNGENAPTPAPPPTPPGVRTDDARNGFAAPRPIPAPVACVRNPKPSEVPPPPPNGVSPPVPAPVGVKPVGCAAWPKLPPRPNPPLAPVPTPRVGEDTTLGLGPSPAPTKVPAPLVPVVPAYGDAVAVAESSSGVVGSDCGIGGSASSSDAPNDDVGLKVLIPEVNPVVCGRSGAPVGWLDSAVLPVGCTPSEPKTDPEKVDPVVVDAVLGLVGVDVVVLGEPKEVSDNWGACAPPVPPVTNEDATPVNVDIGKPVAWGLTFTGLCVNCWG